MRYSGGLVKAKKAFQEDLLKDEDYIIYAENAKGYGTLRADSAYILNSITPSDKNTISAFLKESKSKDCKTITTR